MSCYPLSHLADPALLRATFSLVAQDRATTAHLLAHLAEVDPRRLYLPAGYPSMYAWCVGELRLSEDAAAKRIQAARVARRFPVLFPMLADGRLHLSAVCLLAPHLTHATVGDLLPAAAGRTKPELKHLLAERFPRPDLPTLVQALVPAGDAPALALTPACETGEQHAPGHVVAEFHNLGAAAPSPAPAPRARTTPLSAARARLGIVDPLPGAAPPQIDGGSTPTRRRYTLS